MHAMRTAKKGLIMPTIVIPYRNEELLPETLTGIRQTANDVEIIAVDDCSDYEIDTRCADRVIRFEQPRGLCQGRHAGIEAASYDEVICLDSHMGFMANEWEETLAKAVRKNPTALINGISVRMNEENRDPLWHWSRCRAEVGARFIESQTRSNGQREVMARKWLGTRQFGALYEIPCMLGGVYALNKQYYLDKLAGIWQYHDGWGFSEQLICLAQHFVGNPIYCCGKAPVGHMYRTGKQSTVPYQMAMSRVFHNQALLLMLFTPNDYRERMWEWITGNFQREGKEAMQMVRNKPVEKLRERFYSDERWEKFYTEQLGEEQ